MSYIQPTLTDGMSEYCPHGVDLNYFVCVECQNTPTQTISTRAVDVTWTRTFTEAEQEALTRALLAYRRTGIGITELDMIDGIIRDGWSRNDR